MYGKFGITVDQTTERQWQRVNFPCSNLFDTRFCFDSSQ